MDPKHEIEPGQHLFSQVLDMWVNPEVERRQATGTIPKPVELAAAQVIFSAFTAASATFALNADEW